MELGFSLVMQSPVNLVGRQKVQKGERKEENKGGKNQECNDEVAHVASMIKISKTL